jgi:HEAT repeat protein
MKRILVIGFGALVPLAVVLTVILTRHDDGRPAPDSAESPAPQEGGRPAVPAPTEGNSAPPEYFPATTRDPSLAALVDRDAEDRVSADITSRIPRIRHDEDIPAVVSVLLDTKDDDAVRNEAANLLRRSDYPRLTDDLIKVLNSPDERPRFRAFCVQHLWQNTETAGPAELDGIEAALHSALEDRHAPVRREALLSLVRMRDPKGEETAVKWLLDEHADGVRDAAIRCVRELDLREHIPTIRKYLRDGDEVIHIAAIVTLSQWGDEASRPAIAEAAESNSFRLRRCAEMALKRLGHSGDRLLK